MRDIAADLAVVDHLTLASTHDLEVGGVRAARNLATRLWPVSHLAASHEQFVIDHQHVVAMLERLCGRRSRISDRDFLPGALAMVIAFQQVFARDPLLPPELLPRPWPGRAAREVLVNSRHLALRLRGEHERPALFAAFDQLLADSP